MTKWIPSWDGGNSTQAEDNILQEEGDQMKEHSVIFGADNTVYPYPTGDISKRGYMRGVNTWEDWHLIPSSRPQIAPPEVYTNYIDLPAAHGKIDLSEYLTGGPVYKNRTGSLEFIFANGYGFWAERHNQIYNFLHGKRLYMCLWDEPQYFYYGRFKVQKPNSDGKTNWTTVTIDYELDPFKFPLLRKIEGVDQLDCYWDRYLLDDIHNYQMLDDLHVTDSPVLTIPGYDNGFMIDAVISDRSTFVAGESLTATVKLNSQTVTLTKTAAGEITTKSAAFQPVTSPTNEIRVTGSGDVYVNIVCWGGCL